MMVMVMIIILARDVAQWQRSYLEHPGGARLDPKHNKNNKNEYLFFRLSWNSDELIHVQLLLWCATINKYLVNVVNVAGMALNVVITVTFLLSFPLHLCWSGLPLFTLTALCLVDLNTTKQITWWYGFLWDQLFTSVLLLMVQGMHSAL